MKEFQNKIKEYQTKYQKEEMDNNLLKAQMAELNNTIGRKDIEINDAKYEKKRLESDNAKLLRKICDLNELLSITNTGASSCMKNNAHQESKSGLKQPTIHNIRSTKERKPLQILNDNVDSTLDLLPKKRSSSHAVLSDNKKKSTIINETAINPIVIEDDGENEQDLASHKHIKIRTNTDKKQKENLTSMSSANIPTSTMNSRHRHDRAHLKGDTCVSCAKFYGNEALPAQLNDRNVYLTGQDRIQLHSRHRGQRATTPPGFWTIVYMQMS
ncbi:MAG: hypothetical protein EXX96DRAFT_317367 [Benjaminiella poitrasii]|nr:MAG: hypothetical protein EXX96DRAFT_317367 [Benjaminiella poitrasii]